MQELPEFHQHPWLWLVGSSYEDVVGQRQENGMELICIHIKIQSYRNNNLFMCFVFYIAYFMH